MRMDEYKKAQKMGQKSFRNSLSKGLYPYLQVLDDILEHTEVDTTQPLGLVQIPLESIVGTKTEGRKTAFARNFMPLLEEGSEFSYKWAGLCEAQMEEGIRDPIQAIEFMNRFYVIEGNKRVSVMKYLGAVSIPGNVTRYIPKRNGSKENNIYYEFLEFYQMTQINLIWFTEEGRFAEFVRRVGKEPGESWTAEEKQLLCSVYYRFQPLFEAKSQGQLTITASDALFAFLAAYPYEQVCSMSMDQMRDALNKAWEEILVLTQPEAVEVSLAPTQSSSPGLWARLQNPLRLSSPRLKIAFIYEKTPETSAWTYAHEFGRRELESRFDKQVETICFDQVIPEENGDAVMEQAIAEGCNVIFTTTPRLIPCSVKASVAHPNIKVINCSVNTSHPSIRSYYGRIHEAKFLMGAIAGALCQQKPIGYIGSYPTYGMIAAVNAFALGAKMTNPDAVVHLHWNCVKGTSPEERLKEEGIDLICGLDTRTPDRSPWRVGLYRVQEDNLFNYAMPFWNWGEFYCRMVQSILNGAWQQQAEEVRALNYWWGMDSGVIDVICSRNLPAPTQNLVNILRQVVCEPGFDPFAGEIINQQGNRLYPANHPPLSAEEIITMDWLADNVVGEIPAFDDLIDAAKPLISTVGIQRENPSNT
ncbi:MAG: BMP family ABC transporter substrate-binding protein [Candidatus Fournierella pullistercoris]|uniref:BMP family ABC transporter substrate-binding protein n=1 Tax=Candidatus Allofournierella pullistercoris TaxID=2838597 RepID=A0A948T2A8_9FIRM|nr:BMP family ABC transporter substrate-binding protein [Candidatus Fournierella pullistercoris]